MKNNNRTYRVHPSPQKLSHTPAFSHKKFLSVNVSAKSNHVTNPTIPSEIDRLRTW